MDKPRYSILWSSPAQDDLAGIIDYIARDSIDRADDQYQRIIKKTEQLLTHPESGRIIPELEEISLFTYRELIQKPWRIFYRLEADTVLILAVLDGRRNIADIALDRIIRSGR